MKYITIEAKTYEEAVKKARQQYGDRLRIHSRRDVYVKGIFGLGQNKICELTCFLTGEPEEEQPKEQQQEHTEEQLKEPVKEPEKESVKESVKEEPEEEHLIDELIGQEESLKEDVLPEERSDYEQLKIKKQEEELNKAKEEGKQLLEKAKVILGKNDFTSNSCSVILKELENILNEALPAVPSQEDFETALLDKIVGSITVDHEFQQNIPPVCAVVGTPSSGKTTTIAKMVGLFSSMPTSDLRKYSAVIAIDPPEASYDSLKKIGVAMEIPVSEVSDANDLMSEISVVRNRDIIFLDVTSGSMDSNNVDSKVYQLLSTLTDDKKPGYLMTVPASAKNSDIEAAFEVNRPFGIKGILVTKLDETTTVGNIISICIDKKLPLVFFTDGKKIPRDIKKASSTALALYLKGFSINIRKIIGVDY